MSDDIVTDYLRARVAELLEQVSRQRVWIERLSRTLELHIRTDVAPDAALPEMRALREEIEATRFVRKDVGGSQ